MTRRAARDPLPLPDLPSVEVRPNVGLHAITNRVSLEIPVFVLSIRWREPSGSGRFRSSHSGSVVFSQSRMSWLSAARRAFETMDTSHRLRRALCAGVRAFTHPGN